MSKYKDLSKEELLKLIEKQEAELKSKKYGLVWDAEREPEQVVLDCESNLPVLKRVKGKAIRTNDEDDNILIEGDNYHALTVLNYTHKEKIDVIYIDPPYNTGNKDFVYNDRYVDREDGYRHSKWLNFMEKRLNLAKNLLKETGVIFISIDDNEVAQLKMLCDKVFGEENFIAVMPWKGKGGGADSKFLMVAHEYVFLYAKNRDKYVVGSEIINENDISYNKIDKKINREYKTQLARKWGSSSRREDRPNLFYAIIAPNGDEIYPLLPNGEDGRWRWSKETMKTHLKNGNIEFVKKDGKWVVYERIFKSAGNETKTKKYSTWLDNDGNTAAGSKDLFDIFNSKEFDYPKPLSLIKKMIKIGGNENDFIVLDFFAGSGTTGQAVLELNSEDHGSRKFILCTDNQLNGIGSELVKNNPEENKDEFGICRRVTYPRLEKIINGYQNSKAEDVEGLGGNLQYFKTDSIKKTSTLGTKIDITYKCTEMLCIRENIFNLEEEAEDWKIFFSNKKDKYLCIYYNFIEQSFEKFVEEVKKIKTEKIVYVFSLKSEVDKKVKPFFKGSRLEAVPAEILSIYEEWVKKHVPMRSDLILLEFSRAGDKIFKQKEKDESARMLRIVLEKVILKLAQKNEVQFLKENAKEEKTTFLNDKLKNIEVFSKVEWEENKTYLTIGNHAAHGQYEEYNLAQVENFYKHLQNLLTKFNIQ